MSGDKHMLTDLNTLAVSVVRRGANKRRFAFFKGDDNMDGMEEVLKAILEMELDDEEKFAEFFAKAELDDKAAKALMGTRRLLAAFKENAVVAKILAAVDKAIAGKALAKPEEEEEEKAKKGKAEDYAEPEKTRKDLLANVPAEVKQQLEGLWKENEKLSTTLKTERDERLTTVYLRKAADEFKHIPGESKDLGVFLKDLHDASPDLEAKIVKVLAEVETKLSKSELLTEAGRNATQSDGGSAWQKIEKTAMARVEKSAEKMTKEQAVTEFLSTPEGQDAYQEFLAENPAQTQARN